MNIFNKKLLFFYSVLFLSLLVACGGDPTEPVDLPPEPTQPTAEPNGVAAETITILAFGDSLTAGFGVDEAENYPSQLEAKLLADGYQVEVINGGVSGETSSGGLTRLDWMLTSEPDIVIVETGGNDGLRGVELDETRDNIDQIVGGFSAEAIVIVAGMQIVQNLGEEYTTEFAAIYPAVAERHDAILIPFFLEGVAADPDLNQADFIHPTAEGYTVVVDHIYPFVLDALSRLE